MLSVLMRRCCCCCCCCLECCCFCFISLKIIQKRRDCAPASSEESVRLTERDVLRWSHPLISFVISPDWLGRVPSRPWYALNPHPILSIPPPPNAPLTSTDGRGRRRTSNCRDDPSPSDPVWSRPGGPERARMDGPLRQGVCAILHSVVVPTIFPPTPRCNALYIVLAVTARDTLFLPRSGVSPNQSRRTDLKILFSLKVPRIPRCDASGGLPSC